MESWQETEDVCSSMNRMSCAVRAKSHHFSERLSSTRKNHSRCAMFYFLSGKEVRSFREDVIKRCSMRHEQSREECTILKQFYV